MLQRQQRWWWWEGGNEWRGEMISAGSVNRQAYVSACFSRLSIAIIDFRSDLFSLQTANRYQNLMAGAEEVESCLGSSFAEHLNAEIVLKTISTLDQAVEWLHTTFLYIRVRMDIFHILHSS